jgi:bacillithiol synthase
MEHLSNGDVQTVNVEMDCTASSIPFKGLPWFSKIIVDYLEEADELKSFYEYPVSFAGIEAALMKRKTVRTDRETLVTALKSQYEKVTISAAVKSNIDSLRQETTFTITTAHQPNIFTGYLYFFYKILHTIKLASSLNLRFPGNHFVPVFYMGSEDADLEELGKIFINGEKISWNTDQKGAVGRMKNKGLENIIQRIGGELGIHPYGESLTALLQKCYLSSANIQEATLMLVNELFAEYGLVVLIPDNGSLKKLMHRIFEDDLMQQTPSQIVGETIDRLSAFYKVQANPREINLFYIKDDIRERIVKTGDVWKVKGTSLTFSQEEIIDELTHYPERFSPNVILRGLFQETILPNLVFIGGGGELAYWLELKDLFVHYAVPFPVLMLRNSFLIIERNWKDKLEKLGFKAPDILQENNKLAEELVKRDSGEQTDLKKEIQEIAAVYEQVKNLSVKIDPTLGQHAAALEASTIKRLETLGKKMLKAEKKKFATQLKQLEALRSKLFPNGNLQERVDNFMPYYAKYGKRFIHMLYEQSRDINKAFVTLTVDS